MRVRHVLVFCALLGLFLRLITRGVSSEPYVYDEADYMYAAGLGLAANWTDSGSMPIGDFVRAGLRDGDRRHLSELIRSGNDVLFYRHFHGPLFHYVLVPLARLHLSERATRMAILAIPCISLAIVYFGGLWIGKRGLFPAALFLSSYAVIGSTEVAPHQLFALCALASLILLLKAIETKDRRYWYGAIVAAALGFCTLEIAFVLVATLAICCCIERVRWRVGAAFIAKSVGLFIVIVFVVWPAAIMKLSFLKAYAVLAYEQFYRTGTWGSAGFLDTWSDRVWNSPVEWLLVFMGVAAAIAMRKAAVYPIAIFAALMLAANLRVWTLTPRYSLAFVPALDLLAGLTLVPSRGPLRRPASFAFVALAVAALYGNAWLRITHRARNENPRSATVLTFIYRNRLEHKAVLAPQADVPALHYYFPGMRLRGYFSDVPSPADRDGFPADAVISSVAP